MAAASVTHTFVAATTAVASEVNTNFSDVTTFLNNQVLHLDGSKTMTSDLPMGSNKVVSVAEPTVSSDAATKNYVDNATAQLNDLPTTLNIESGFVNTNTNASGQISVTYSTATTGTGTLQITPFTTSTSVIDHVQVAQSTTTGFTVTCWSGGSRVNSANAQFFWTHIDYS